MLTQLDIRNIVIIKHLHIELGKGLNVFTGETGAGKSILLDALSLAVGSRGDSKLVRYGCKEARITAVFRVLPNAKSLKLLEDSGLVIPEIEDDGRCELILRRVQTISGVTKSFINDEPVRVALLKQVGSSLLEIHAQHDSRALLENASHRDALDSFAGTTDLIKSLSKTYHNILEVDKEIAEKQRQFQAIERDRDYIIHASDELELLNPLPGEEAELIEKRIILSHQEDFEKALFDLEKIVSGSGSLIAKISGWINKYANTGKWKMPEEIVQNAEQLIVNSEYLQEHIDTTLNSSQSDSASISAIDERLSELHDMARKFRVRVDDLPAELERFGSQLMSLETQKVTLSNLADQRGELISEYHKQAIELTANRQDAAIQIENAIAKELPTLRLGHVVFKVALSAYNEDEMTAHGAEKVTFMVSTVPGTPTAPLMSVVSGGELSRIMLALKSIVGNKSNNSTMIFDEIDTGVGGAVADAIGMRLFEMAKGEQALVVSHLAQIAARAQHHYLIEKSVNTDNSDTFTDVRKLTQSQRVEEIARMISGTKVSESSIASARDLLDLATH